MASRALNSPAMPDGRDSSDFRQMRQPFAVSAAFHLALLLFAIFGLHLLPKKDLPIAPPISVSMVKPSEIARTTHVDEAHEAKEEPVQPQQSKAPEPPKQSQSAPPPPPPVTQPVQQPPTPAPPPPPPKPLEPIQKPPEPQPKPLPKPAPPPKPVPVIKTAPQPPKPDKPKTKQVDQEFASLLTSLTPPVPKADQITKEKPVKSQAPSAARAEIGNQMTADEMAVVRERLKLCWILPAGSYDAEHLVILVVAKYNQDKTLSSETLYDTDNRYNRDPTYRAAADSALRALRNPECNPLPWPDGKYEDWKETTINFNPQMLNN